MILLLIVTTRWFICHLNSQKSEDMLENVRVRQVKVMNPSKLVGINYDYIYIASHKAYEIYRDLISDGFEQKKSIRSKAVLILTSEQKGRMQYL